MVIALTFFTMRLHCKKAQSKQLLTFLLQCSKITHHTKAHCFLMGRIEDSLKASPVRRYDDLTGIIKDSYGVLDLLLPIIISVRYYQLHGFSFIGRSDRFPYLMTGLVLYCDTPLNTY